MNLHALVHHLIDYFGNLEATFRRFDCHPAGCQYFGSEGICLVKFTFGFISNSQQFKRCLRQLSEIFKAKKLARIRLRAFVILILNY